MTKTIESTLGKVFAVAEIEYGTFFDNIHGFLENSAILLYRIVRECASNIVKHLHADKAVLRIEHDAQTLTVKVSDNGKGFDTVGSGMATSERRFWVIGVAEWTRLLRGKMKIDSNPGKRTTVTIVIGLQANPR